MKWYFIEDKIKNKTTGYRYVSEMKEMAWKKQCKYQFKGINAKLIFDGEYRIIIEEE